MADVAIPQEVWSHAIALRPQTSIDWLLHGFVATGNITLLTSQWKAGKTTLLTLLLSRRAQGGTLAGLAVRPGKSVVVSEEPESVWGERIRRLQLGDSLCLFARPFHGFPSPDQWQ